MKKIISLSAALVLCASLASGCGKDKKDSSEKKASKYEGKWQCSEIVSGDKTETSVFGVDASALFQIELKEYNKGTFLSFLFSEENKPEDIEWEEKEDNKITLTGGPLADINEEFVLEYKDDKLVLDMSDEEDEEKSYANLVKVDEFTAIPDDAEMSLDFSGEANADFELDE